VVSVEKFDFEQAPTKNTEIISSVLAAECLRGAIILSRLHSDAHHRCRG
jgi:hypothetical protein